MAAAIGFCHAWANHNYLINADAMSYLDIAETYLRGDWSNAINAYWSPLYSWLIALALLLIKPSSYWKFAVLHLVNFAIYLFSLACFAFLIREMVRFQLSIRDKALARGLVILPRWAILALGYPLFVWSTLYLIILPVESPDMLVASIVYLASGLLLRIRLQPSRWLPVIFLGISLGIGYLAKSVMFPIAILFLAACGFSFGSLRRALPRLVVALAFFILIAGPFVFAISRQKGRLTFGESGTLNYLWAINRVTAPHWQGEEAGFGTPKHTTRKIFQSPPIYEFGEPVRGTYPVWYDPTYWYEGSVRHFDLRRQLSVMRRAVEEYYALFHSWGLQYGLLVGLLTLYLMGRRGMLIFRDLLTHWSLILPALAGLGLYALVNVQGRYVASFFVLLWLACFCAMRLPDTPGGPKLIKAITLVLMAVTACTTLASSGSEIASTARHLVSGEDRSAHDQWQIAEGLRAMGMVPGDRVAVIGDSFRAFWAHLAGLRIVAEVPNSQRSNFWESDLTVRDQMIKAFASTGAKAIVVESPHSGADLTGWQKIGDTDFYAYFLKP